jgi:hydrogenase maturation protease
MKRLIVAFGNSLRKDDGISFILIDMLKNELRDTDFISNSQILPEDLLHYADYNKVYFVDADLSIGEGRVVVENIDDLVDKSSYYHGLNISDLYRVGIKLGIIKGEWYLITIGVKDVGYGENISSELIYSLKSIKSTLINILH